MCEGAFEGKLSKCDNCFKKFESCLHGKYCFHTCAGYAGMNAKEAKAICKPSLILTITSRIDEKNVNEFLVGTTLYKDSNILLNLRKVHDVWRWQLGAGSFSVNYSCSYFQIGKKWEAGPCRAKVYHVVCMTLKCQMEWDVDTPLKFENGMLMNEIYDVSSCQLLCQFFVERCLAYEYASKPFSCWIFTDGSKTTDLKHHVNQFIKPLECDNLAPDTQAGRSINATEDPNLVRDDGNIQALKLRVDYISELEKNLPILITVVMTLLLANIILLYKIVAIIFDPIYSKQQSKFDTDIEYIRNGFGLHWLRMSERMFYMQ
ncbi:hypothetical protein HELRODRAFT_162505 [Helobdella robusta]|uniref:C-type lectin domain-containing protein n=1 Tax=Helobdella robusta TaxID=6412 RepID=T1ESR7_HELRO|nr:hypothetical protein HELRODRAFT_162505 [Helobdella robusta]ESN99026.1 hypothetical protein HELRODRAFT_162505 [Helobdella robusta]